MNQITPIPQQLRAWNWKSVRISIGLSLAGLAMIPWSDHVFRFSYTLLRSLPFTSLFDAAVQFASAAFMLVVFAAVFLLDKPRAKTLVYLTVSLATVSLMNSTVKQVAGRSRPEWSVAMSKSKKKELQEFNIANPSTPVPVTKTDHWFGVSLNRPYFMDRYASFPSGHSASVFALAAFLCILYPRGKVLWLSCAILCALSRVYGERHYLEDVMAGGSLGWIVSLWVFSWRWPMRLACKANYLSPELIKRSMGSPPLDSIY